MCFCVSLAICISTVGPSHTIRDYLDVMCDLCLSFLCSVKYDVTSKSKEVMLIWNACCSKFREITFKPFRVIRASDYKMVVLQSNESASHRAAREDTF